jgi:NADH-quinone oxidoreductase subunit N
LGKFFAFQSALDSKIVWLVVIAAINSVIGAYYYLRVIIAMYFWEPSKDYVPSSVAPTLGFALLVAAAGTLYLGILPARVLGLAKMAADSIGFR